MFRLFNKRFNKRENVDDTYEKGLRDGQALEKGQQAGKAICAEVDAFMDPRLEAGDKEIFRVLAEQLDKIVREPGDNPIRQMAVEVKTFAQEYDAGIEDLYKAFARSCADWIKLADEIGVRELLDEYVGKKIATAKESSGHVVARMLAETNARLEKMRRPDLFAALRHALRRRQRHVAIFAIVRLPVSRRT